MNLENLHKTVRAHARDFNETIFRKEDITMFVNEGIDRIIQVLPILNNMPYLNLDEDTVELIPREYVHLLANYSVARLFMQDERHYEATSFMNEFEIKLEEFRDKVENGDIIITDPETGEALDITYDVDYVTDNYFFGHRRGTSNVEGV